MKWLHSKKHYFSSGGEIVDMYLKSAIEGVVIKWATQINDVLTQESSQAFDGGQNPTPNVGKLLKNMFIY